jgi:hypothetical protein
LHGYFEERYKTQLLALKARFKYAEPEAGLCTLNQVDP